MSHTEEFDKTLSKAEIDAEDYLDWSDETLGRCVRSVAKDLLETEMPSWKGITFMASVLNLIRFATSINAGNIRQVVDGYTDKSNSDVPTKWKVEITAMEETK